MPAWWVSDHGYILGEIGMGEPLAAKPASDPLDDYDDSPPMARACRHCGKSASDTCCSAAYADSEIDERNYEAPGD